MRDLYLISDDRELLAYPADHGSKRVAQRVHQWEAALASLSGRKDPQALWARGELENACAQAQALIKAAPSLEAARGALAKALADVTKASAAWHVAREQARTPDADAKKIGAAYLALDRATQARASAHDSLRATCTDHEKHFEAPLPLGDWDSDGGDLEAERFSRKAQRLMFWDDTPESFVDFSGDQPSPAQFVAYVVAESPYTDPWSAAAFSERWQAFAHKYGIAYERVPIAELVRRADKAATIGGRAKAAVANVWGAL